MFTNLGKALLYGLVEFILLLCVVLFAGFFVLTISKLWLALLMLILAFVAVIFAFGIFPRYAMRKLHE